VWPQWWNFANVSQQGLDFSKKISKMKICFWFVHTDRQKLGTILENNAVQKLKFSKNDNFKKHSSKLIFFNEKKIRKIRMIIDVENWLWKSDLGTFWRPM
jgi:hypothetical protein